MLKEGCQGATSWLGMAWLLCLQYHILSGELELSSSLSYLRGPNGGNRGEVRTKMKQGEVGAAK